MGMLVVTLNSKINKEDRVRVASELKELQGVLSVHFNDSVRILDKVDWLRTVQVSFKNEDTKSKAALKDAAKRIKGVKDAWVSY